MIEKKKGRQTDKDTVRKTETDKQIHTEKGENRDYHSFIFQNSGKLQQLSILLKRNWKKIIKKQTNNQTKKMLFENQPEKANCREKLCARTPPTQPIICILHFMLNRVHVMILHHCLLLTVSQCANLNLLMATKLILIGQEYETKTRGDA